jgi:hypothetical protein
MTSTKMDGASATSISFLFRSTTFQFLMDNIICMVNMSINDGKCLICGPQNFHHLYCLPLHSAILLMFIGSWPMKHILGYDTKF